MVCCFCFLFREKSGEFEKCDSCGFAAIFSKNELLLNNRIKVKIKDNY